MGRHPLLRQPAADDPGPLTWPEGHGWVASRLRASIGARLRTDQPVMRVRRAGTAWTVTTPTTTWTTDAVIFAAPLWLAPWVVEGWQGPTGLVTSPWLVANLTLDRWPAERGLEPAWDNVLFDSEGLGYVVATHQSLRTWQPRTVWTYYWALAHGPSVEARRWLLDSVVGDAGDAHPRRSRRARTRTSGSA